jgi:membrane associated rhomboid family serine protease
MPLPPQLRWRLDRLRDRAAALFRPEEKKEGRPRLCPACGHLVGASAKRCHECGTSMTFSVAAVGRSISSVLPKTSPVTILMVGLNLLIYAVCLARTMQDSQTFNPMGGVEGQLLYRFGARATYEIYQGEWWRLVMPIFLHGSVWHIGMNTLVLVNLGPPLESLYGSARYLFLYIVTGVISFVFSTAWSLLAYHGGGLSVGASGAIMGLAGLQLAVASRRGGRYMAEVRMQLIRWIALVFALGLVVGGIDNAAHFGGLVSGFALGRVFADREPNSGPERTRAYALGAGALVLVAASFAAMMLNYFRNTS